MNDLAFVQGSDNLSGTVDAIYAVAQSDVDDTALPALAIAGELKITAALTLKAAKKFGALYITDETGELTIKTVGERDGKSVECMLSGSYPLLDTAALNWLRGIQNGPLLLIFKMANTGKKFIMGLSNLDKATTVVSLFPPVYFEGVDAKSGKKRADANGAIMSFKWNSAHGPIEYTGAIDITG